MLHAINGKEISDNNRAAHLQFDISEGVFYGNGGCNNISGSIEHSETTITFSKVAATLMHCENIEDEHKFLSKLEDATYNIQLSRDDLRQIGRASCRERVERAGGKGAAAENKITRQ